MKKFFYVKIPSVNGKSSSKFFSCLNFEGGFFQQELKILKIKTLKKGEKIKKSIIFFQHFTSYDTGKKKFVYKIDFDTI